MEVAGKRLETNTCNETELCEPCATESQSKPADGFCTDCNEFMCQECFRHHLKGKLCRNHILDPLNGVSSQQTQRIQEEKCKIHAKETIKYYCRTHNAVGCGDCLVSEHQKCDTQFIKDLAKNYEESSEFKTLLRQIMKWETEKAEDETRIETNRNENKTLLDNAFEEIRKFRKEINNWLDEMEKNLEAEVRNISDDNEKQMSMLGEKIKSIMSEIESIKEQLDTNVYHADNLFIRHVECMTRIGQVDKTLAEIKPNNVIKSYIFEPETKVKDMFTSSVKLGIIRVNQKMIPENKQPAKDEYSAQIAVKVKRGTKTVNKQQTNSDTSAKKNVYQHPDPRAYGFDVGKRVTTVWETGVEGTVFSVEPSGYVIVKWDRGNTLSYWTNQLKLL